MVAWGGWGGCGWGQLIQRLGRRLVADKRLVFVQQLAHEQFLAAGLRYTDHNRVRGRSEHEETGRPTRGRLLVFCRMLRNVMKRSLLLVLPPVCGLVLISVRGTLRSQPQDQADFVGTWILGSRIENGKEYCRRAFYEETSSAMECQAEYVVTLPSNGLLRVAASRFFRWSILLGFRGCNLFPVWARLR
jgi:hypothetical protein